WSCLLAIDAQNQVIMQLLYDTIGISCPNLAGIQNKFGVVAANAVACDSKIYRKELIDVSEIIVLLVPEVMAQGDYYFLSSCISNSRRKKLNRFINKKDAYRSLLAETLVRKVIIDNLDIPNSAIQFGKRKYGKPFLCGQANFHFNISHSGQWVV